MKFLKGKSLEQKAQDEQNKLKFTRMKLANTEIDNQLKAAEAQKRRLALQRLMA